MYTGLMTSECVVEFVKHTLVHSMVCDPIFDMISMGVAYAGFPLISAIIDFFPERDSHLAHVLTLGICLAKQAYAKMGKYTFLKKIKAAVGKAATSMKNLADELVTMKKGIVAVLDNKASTKVKGAAGAAATKVKDLWQMIAVVKVPGFGDVQKKVEDESFGNHDSFTQNLADVTDLLRYVQNIPGIEWAGGVAFGNLIDISTGITDANEHSHGDSGDATHDHAEPSAEDHSNMKAFFAKSKDLLVKGARARDNLCEFLYEKAVTLKDMFWTKSVNEIIAMADKNTREGWTKPQE